MKTIKIHFQKEDSTGFYATIRNKVNIKINKDCKTSYLPATKALFLITLYILSCIQILRIQYIPGVLFSYVILGVLTTGIFLNIVHDAAHNALFKKQLWNNCAFHFLEIFGTDSYIWKKRHIISHHSYPNITGKDFDIRQTNLIRILPNSQFLSHHSYQPYYAPLVYTLYTLNWFFHRDLVDAFVHNKELKVGTGRKVKLIVHKIIYLFLFIVLPSLLTSLPIAVYIIGFFIMHITASLIGVMALTTAHVSHDSDFPEPDENGMMPDSWAMHQLRVTQDFAPDNKFITTWFGGFNLHIAHHLFPSIQHRHYNIITQIIKETAEDFGIEYKSKSLGEALWSHYLLLISNSRKPIEIDM